MAQPQLAHSDHPILFRGVLRIYEFCSSLKLAVVLIFSTAFTLGFATFVEAAYGTPVVQFFVYQTWWFSGLNFALGINIFCAAAIRYPWKRYQTGFVITHIGLLTLLIGAAIGRKYGVDAQIPVFEHKMEHFAFDRAKMFFDLEIIDDHPESAQHDHQDFVHSQGRIPFLPGPFNWDHYEDQFNYTLAGGKPFTGSMGLIKNGLRWTSGHVFKLARRHTAGDVLMDRQLENENQQPGPRVKIEVLDFQADSKKTAEPRIEIVLSNPPEPYLDESTGKQEEREGAFDPDNPNTVSISIVPLPKEMEDIYGEIYPYGFSQPQQAGGGKVMLWIAPDPEYRAAFLEAAPVGELGPRGQVVLRVDGTTHYIDMNGRQPSEVIPLENSDLRVEVRGLWNDAVEGNPDNPDSVYGYTNLLQQTSPESPAAHLQVIDSKGEPWGREILLFASKPHHNVYDYSKKIYGTYWFDFSKKEIQPFSRDPAAQEQVYSRIEFLQGDDQKLYYRYWNRRTNQLVHAQALETEGVPSTAASGFQMPQFQLPLRFYVNDFVRSDKPRPSSQALPFNRDLQIVQRRVMALIRVTFGETTEEHWIRAFVGAPGERRDPDQEVRIHDELSRQTLVLSMPTQALDIGFRIRLKDFERKLDPGTSQASHYSSWVDFIDLKSTRAIWSVPLSGGPAASIGIPANAVAENLLEPASTQSVSGFAISKSETIYWIDPDQRQLQKTDLSSGNTEVLLSESLLQSLPPGQRGGVLLNRPRNLVLDEVHNQLIWVDEIGGNHMIQQISTQGNSAKRITISSGVISDIALDPGRGHIYWVDALAGEINRAPLDGSGVPEVVAEDLRKPTHLAIDTQQKTLFWNQADPSANSASTIGSIYSQSLDSETSPRLLVKLEIECHCVSMTFDQQTDTLYFIEAEQPARGYIGHHSSTPHHTHRLKSIKPTGQQEVDLQVTGIDLAQHLQVVNGTLYWDQSALFRHDVYITMNAPVQFDSPTNGHSYRLFQESFSGPWQPGEAEYERVIPADSMQTDLYLSVLTVNRDPGRAIRNFGCLIVCLGIAIMFYMKAYFFKSSPSRRKAKTSPVPDKNNDSQTEPPSYAHEAQH